MNPRRRQCLANFSAAALLPFPLGLQSRQPAARAWPAVQNALGEFAHERSGSGTSVAIQYGDSPPSYLHAGTLAFDSDAPFDENSICRLYSMTKHVTRIATLLLVEDGTLSLDQPATDYLPEFKNLRVAIDVEKGLESRPVTKTMTVRHLITNTSGLGSWTPASDSGEELHKLYRERGITPGNRGAGLRRPEFGPQAKTMEEMVARVAELPLAYEPGTVLHYSIGFDVMALVIQRATRMPYGEFLRKRIFGPLGMKSTAFEVKAADAARLTTNYDATGRYHDVNASIDPALPPGAFVTDDRATSDWLKPPTLVAGGAGLVSTSREFLRYAEMLLHEGTYGGAHIMSVETARLATGNIHPQGVADPSEGVGAGSRALLMGGIIPPGMVGGGGAAGTLFWIDQKRRGAVVFMAQTLYGSPAKSPYQKRLFAAIEADLAS